MAYIAPRSLEEFGRVNCHKQTCRNDSITK